MIRIALTTGFLRSKNKMKLRFVPLFATALLMGGCQSTKLPPSDQNIIGSWSEEFGTQARSISTFNKDHTYEGKLYAPPTDFNPTTFQGTWEINDGILTYMIDSSSDMNYPHLGKETKDEIIYLDKHTFKYKSLDYGFESSMTKISNQTK